MAEKLHDEEVRALDRPAAGREAMVPSSYAEKAMSSLLRLHEDLVEEKERRIDLYRRLMEREQSLAEMRAYVKLLEVELARRGFDPTQYAIDPATAKPPSAEQRQAVAQAAAVQAVAAQPPPPPVVQQAVQQAVHAQAPATQAPAAARVAPATQPPAAGQVPVAPQPQVAAATQPAPAAAPTAPGEPWSSPVIAWTPGPGSSGIVR